MTFRILIATLLVGLTGRASDTNGVMWIDGKDLPAEGRPFPDSPTYARIPPRFAGVLPQRDLALGSNTAGRVFRFITDSRKLRFRWSLVFADKAMYHMQMVGTSGVDVYRRTGRGAWRAHTGRRRLVPLGAPDANGEYACEMDWTPGDECLLYLPCYNGIRSLRLGVDAGAKVEKGLPHRGAAKPVVLFGHSITQGGCASRGGLAWSAIVGRRLDVEIVNLGLSGSALMEIEWARALGELDPSVFVLDTSDNQTMERVTTRYENFLRELHRLRPGVPIVILENTDVHDFARKHEIDKAIRAIVEKLIKEDPKEWQPVLDIIAHDELVADDEGTVDGIHLNDLGMKAVADTVERRLRPHLGLEYPKVEFTRQRLFPGYDGKFCKFTPEVATDGKGLAFLTYTKFLLSGSDVFYGSYLSRSTDGGKTWQDPVEETSFPDRKENGVRVHSSVSLKYNRTLGRWYGLGFESLFKNDAEPFMRCVNGRPFRRPFSCTFDPAKGVYGNLKTLPFPFPYAGAMPFGQVAECENGDVIVPFYFTEPGADRGVGLATPSHVVTVRYAADGDGFRVVKAGEPLRAPHLRRGFGEPSLVRTGGKYYFTLRSDEAGYFAESDDGLVFAEPRLWTWNGIKPIGNRNTQQHWVSLKGRLYLAYTREGAANDHVFRNRAPIFLALFDAEKGCLVKETEMPIVPELGARLGNFCVADAGEEQWLVTAEGMLPAGRERYGSDNSLWLVRMKEDPCRRRR